MNKLIYKIKPPCPKCLYKLGHIQAVFNPCPHCKMNGYRMFKQFKKQTEKDPR